MAQNMMENLQTIVQNTAADSIKMIDIDELHASPDNFFAVENIEELAEAILGQGGIKDNLLVVPMKSGGYEIVSGHRRTAAVRYLLERGENISRYLPCLVQNYWDEADKQFDMILLNISSRKISDAELLQSYEILNRILQEKKSSGSKFGRVREKLAEMLGVSNGQISSRSRTLHISLHFSFRTIRKISYSGRTAAAWRTENSGLRSISRKTTPMMRLSSF
jgi:ParB family chromosome partitioning protein